MEKLKEYRKAKNIDSLKKLISKEIILGYECKIDFDKPYYLIEIGNVLIITAKLYKEDNKMVYNFVFDTSFIGDHLVTYEEIVMIHAVLDVLNNNKKLITSRFKQYTVEEYEKEEEKANYFLEHIEKAFENSLSRTYEKIIKSEKK